MAVISRRMFMGGVAAAVVAARWQAATGPLSAAPLPVDPFTLGVASGDPLPDGFVLWTRLAPDPTNGGGMPAGDVAVGWEVAADAGFADVVAAGTAPAVEALAHSVHVEVDGLDPDAWYHYRFTAGGHTSPVGRARTTPAGVARTPLRFGVASCQNYADGYYTAHAHLAQEGCDLVLFLGDYIYEGGDTGPVRSHGSGETFTLADYRNRYGLYKSDANLQAAHAACPWLVIWDDHEVDNNYAGSHDSKGTPEADFLVRRAAGYRAWYEHQPVRLEAPTGPDLAIHRGLAWGSLAAVHLLDTRQHRDDQVCGDGLSPRCAELDDPTRTMIGSDQESWLLDRLRATSTVWDVVAQQVVFAPMPIFSSVNTDQWDGYPASRQRVWEVLRDVPNPLVVTGDIHAAGVARLHRTLDNAFTRREGTELVGTSISSGFGAAPPALAQQIIGNLPWVDYVNAADRGYIVVDLTEQALHAEYRVVATAGAPTSTVRTDHVVDVAATPVALPEPEPTTTSTTSAPTSTTTTTAPSADPGGTAARPVTAAPRLTG